MYRQNVIKKKYAITYIDPDMPGDLMDLYTTVTVTAESEASALLQIPAVYKVIEVIELSKGEG